MIADVHTTSNRLIEETSPYLLQHAYNPVNWYPWGDDAFEKAEKEDKPIFLSIGYSSCHWCHVMEKESFEDDDVADYLNQHFVSIKVDREERPDIDRIYMDAVVGMTGHGGWPLSVFLTPDRNPFYGGTYFPPDNRYGRPGFMTLLQNIQQLWSTRKSEVVNSAEQILEAISAQIVSEPADSLASDALQRLADQLSREFDEKHGGFSSAPKFPPSSELRLLLRQYHYTKNKQLLNMAEKTLTAMAQGGMYDQLGGGFHRYSTDDEWLVPHFEKMLYDNAQLAVVYYEAYQITRKRFYLRIANETLDYVLKEMVDSGGGFYSAEDADSEGEEGKYYAWTPGEIESVLGPETAAQVIEYYGVTTKGNFEGGKSILHLPISHNAFVRSNELSKPEWTKVLEEARRALLVERKKRVAPGKDDKIIAGWNGLMMSAFCRGYQITGNRQYLMAAKRNAEFLLTSMRNDDGELLRSFRKDQARIGAFIDDYAFVIGGLIDLYESTFTWRWLEAADELAGVMIRLFWDDEDAGFFFHNGKDKTVVNRTKQLHDMALPSGNAIAIQDLQRLAVFLDNGRYGEKAHRALLVLSGRIQQAPRGYEETVAAIDFFLHPPPEIGIVGALDSADGRALVRAAYTKYLPDRVIALMDPGSNHGGSIEKNIPLLTGRKNINGKATVYVCQNYACKLPVTNPKDLSDLITKFYSGDR